MYDDLIDGFLGSPGLVDVAFSLRSPSGYTDWWADVITSFRDFFYWFLDSVPVFCSWVRDTPLVLAVISFFVTGFVISIFFRVFNSV